MIPYAVFYKIFFLFMVEYGFINGVDLASEWLGFIFISVTVPVQISCYVRAVYVVLVHYFGNKTCLSC